MNNDDLDDEKLITDIWRNLNISTVLFLKLFEDICANAEFRNDAFISIRVPIHFLSFEYGLLNCYVSKDYTLLKLVFDKEIAIGDRRITDSYYYSFIDRLIDSKYYHSLDVVYDELLVVSLVIPSEFKSDIKLIAEQSKYSQTSKLFKSKMSADFSRNEEGKPIIPRIPNIKARYILKRNIPFNIVTKNKKLQERIFKAFDVELNDNDSKDVEFFRLWENDREIYSKRNLKKYVSNSL